jgi:hypothetical protein
MPAWHDEAVVFKVKKGEVVITVLDEGLLTDREIGHCVFDTKLLINISPFRGWVKLRHEGYVVGELLITIINPDKM